MVAALRNFVTWLKFIWWKYSSENLADVIGHVAMTTMLVVPTNVNNFESLVFEKIILCKKTTISRFPEIWYSFGDVIKKCGRQPIIFLVVLSFH